MAETIRTTCPYCGVGCGILATPREDGQFDIKGDPEHPANFGRLCSKGSALGETLDLEGRLLEPKIAGNSASWDQAIATVAENFTKAIKDHGPDAVAFYVSGQLLSEDYYVANKLMKGFIGSANIDTNSRLCMSSSVAGHKRGFGADTVPGCYEDLEEADLVVLVGSNLAWCHPVLYQRLVKAREDHGTKVVVIDPKKTETCDIADLHLNLKPGTDVALFNGLLSYLDSNGHRDHDYVASCCDNVEHVVNQARDLAGDSRRVAKICDIPLKQLADFFALFAATEKVVTVYSQGVNQSVQGTDKVNAILNCHLLTGRIGKPGACPFSVTGQPNAMGGREVGGLSNTLAAHMGFDPDEHDLVQRFWNSPQIASGPGLKAVELFEAVHQGKIKALWIMATNPVVSLPNATRVKEALDKCDFLVVSDCMEKTDTSLFADVVLPAATWGERNGTVTNSERRISRQRPFLALPGQAKPDWQIISEVAKAMGHGAAFDYKSSYDVFIEHAQLSGFENNDTRDFDISALAKLNREEFDQQVPVQWPVNEQYPNGRKRFFDDQRFYTPSKKAQLINCDLRLPALQRSPTFPLLLNTGRIRDQWHTMTRTGKSPRLARHRAEAYLEVHPSDAEQFGLTQDKFCVVESAFGQTRLKVRISEDVRPGEVFAPIHWTAQNSSDGAIGGLINSECDPHSGQPGLKYTPVWVSPWQEKWQGFIVSRKALDLPKTLIWSRLTGSNCSLYEFAAQETEADWSELASTLLDCQPGEGISVNDAARGTFRFAKWDGEKVEACFFITREGRLPSRDWLLSVFKENAASDETRLHILAGQSPSGNADQGEIVCSCFGVGIKTILGAITDQGLISVDEIGRALQAGTNCGSCKPELAKILNQSLKQPVNLEDVA